MRSLNTQRPWTVINDNRQKSKHNRLYRISWPSIEIYLSGLIAKMKHKLGHIFFLSFLVGPAPVLSPTHFSPLRREVHSGPLKRSWGRRQRRDITPPTPTSTRTLNCSASSQKLSQPSASWTHTCTDYSHTHHSIMFCTKILLLTLNWPLLDKNGVGGAFFCFKEVKESEQSL